MAVAVEAEACLGVEEVVLLVDVEIMLAVGAVFVVDELVVVAVGGVVHVAVLQVGKHVPLFRDVVGGLHVGVAVELLGVGVIVLVVAVLQQIVSQGLVRHIGEIAEVVARELLHRQSADDIPQLVFVVHVAHDSIHVLFQALLAHEVALLDGRAVGCIVVAQAELLEFVVQAELVVVAVSVRVVQRGGRCPMRVDVPRGGQNVVALPEVVGRLVPIAAVGHLVAVGRIVAIGVDGRVPVVAVAQGLVERVVSSQTSFVEVLVGLDARCRSVGAVHQREVAIAGSHPVPRLSRFLEVSEVLVGDGEFVVDVA